MEGTRDFFGILSSIYLLFGVIATDKVAMTFDLRGAVSMVWLHGTQCSAGECFRGKCGENKALGRSHIVFLWFWCA